MSAERRRYQSSGQVTWGQFLPWVGLTLLVSSGAGYLLYLAYLSEWYIGIATPLIVTALATLLAHLTVRNGHCRNAVVAGLLGAGAGLVVFGSSYYADLLERQGIADPFALADHIVFRLETDSYEVHGKGWIISPPKAPPGAAPADGNLFLRWLGFGLDALALVGLPLAMALRAVRRPYSEASGQWMVDESVRCPVESGAALIEQLTRERPLDLTALNARTVDASEPHSLWTLHYAPATDGQPDGTPVYLSVAYVGGKSRYEHLDRVELRPEEAAALVSRFPNLLEWAGERASPVEPEDSTPAAADVATMTRIPEPHRGRVLTPGMAVGRNLLALVPMAGLLGTFPVAYLVARFGGPVLHPGWVVGINLAVFTCGMAWGVVTMCYPLRFGTAYLVRVMRRQWRTRTDAWVSPDEPDVLVVEMIPRRNWHTAKLESAEDVGLLAIDSARRELRFEGDQERYRIPAKAIASCAVELIHGPGDSRSVYGLVLRIRLPDREREVPWLVLKGLPGRTDLDRSQELGQRINRLRWDDEWATDASETLSPPNRAGPETVSHTPDT